MGVRVIANYEGNELVFMCSTKLGLIDPTVAKDRERERERERERVCLPGLEP
jgi:hypothetical protein